MKISVSCSCGKKLSAPPHLAGKTVRCPGCQSPLAIPASAPTDPIKVSCQCGQSFAAKPELAGKQVSCPSCQSPLTIPTGNAPAQTATKPIVVSCHCGQRFEAQPHLIGKQLPCPACQQPILVSAAQAAPQVQQPTPQPAVDDPLGLGASFDSPQTQDDDLFGDLPAATMNAPAMPTVAATPAPKPASPHSQTGGSNEYIANAQAEKAFYGESNQSQGTGAIFSGIGMMAGAVVWLCGGLALGVFFPYPIILFVIGAVTLINGIGLKMRD